MAFNMSEGAASNTNINMDTMDDSETNAKISDSAYSNSCSNSQARSRSSHSTHSGSHSSGSSGYGGKPSTSGYSSNNVSQPPVELRCKVKKKKKQPEETLEVQEEEPSPPEPEPEVKPVEEECVDAASSPAQPAEASCVESMDISTPERSSVKDKASTCNFPVNTTNRPFANIADGFSCVISMQDGVVMYTTSSLTNTLGFPKDMWIGRSFIDFVHPRDRNTFASLITNGLAAPKTVNGNTVSTMVCRIRRYRGLTSGFGIKERIVTFMPFLLKLSFRNICDEEGEVIYLLVQATPFFSAFKSPNELVSKAVPFVIRHAANGDIKYIDPESVPYLGYSPQDIVNKDALHLYHPHDLAYLRQVYETIVKEGGVPRSKPYRMMAQNGDYVKLETEWSSFINPWSRKLEFVIGKHLLIEGPNNPDVFQSADIEKSFKFSEDEKNKAQTLRESIVRIMNELLTKPAEAAKQQMTKRCQDLASFMESLMEEAPKTDDEMWLDIKEPDNGYYERDSVMLGGISPHHDCNDSKSSTETQISYNQLNYNETLQRYFDSHLLFSEENNSDTPSDRPSGNKNIKTNSSGMSPMAQNSGDFGDMTSSCDSSALALSNSTPMGDYYQPVRLTESALSKHNAVMEKELMKLHREIKTVTKDDRKKASKESRQKKKEHLARCNASFLPTSAGLSTVDSQPHGLKRSSRHSDDSETGYKYRYSTAKLPRRKQSTSAAPAHPSNTLTNTLVSSPMPTNSMNMNNMNTFFLGVSIPQQMSMMSPVAAMPGMFPICYAMPASSQQMMQNDTEMPNQGPSTSNHPFTMPYVMYGQPVYGSPFMYSPINAQMGMQYPMQPGFVAQGMNAAMHPLGLSSGNYQEACKLTFPTKSKLVPSSTWREKRAEQLAAAAKKDKSSGTSNSSAAVSNLSANAATENRSKGKERLGNSDATNEKTDEESSYSSFYSNFFKSESGSAEESDVKKRSMDPIPPYESQQAKKVARRKMDPPWMEHVCVTSELIYKYQVLPKTMEEVLSCDKKRLETLEQPTLVNEQLGQLYLDLQLEGVAARLTLEEGLTSSSSSGEENFSRSPKVQGRRRKREYSKLVMIYEEDAPLPPPEDAASSSTS
ncbi:period circadian protein-like isoform X2 [Colias croceus]|uniref:period circadian protein-like isoform X2 n=1 Tax=Colias crocea TaxID=72248 RepID=UPI001E281A9D|nr:period circadian protein-like isoform X2 [Colias croceus]